MPDEEYVDNPEAEPFDVCNYLAAQYGDYQAWRDARQCALGRPGQEAGCPTVALRCPEYDSILSEHGNDCQDGQTGFVGSVDAVEDLEDRHEERVLFCPVDLRRDSVWVTVHGKQRACVGGEVGALLAEQAEVDIERVAVLNRLQTLIRRMNAVYEFGNAVHQRHHSNQALATGFNAVNLGLETAAEIMRAAGDSVEEAAEAPACLVIAGFSVGTNCPGKVASAIGKSTLIYTMKGGAVYLDAARWALEIAIEHDDRDLEMDERDQEVYLELRLLARDMEELFEEYRVLTQAALSLTAILDDLRADVTRAIEKYDRKVSFAADHLVGRERGYVLLGDHLVAEADKTFQEVLQKIYRMVMAFNHQFNVTPGEAAQLVARAQALVTLDDAAVFIREIEERARDYCGTESIDCDWSTNLHVLRYSVRDQLFPHLRDIVDARTGEVVTAGEQFHDTITQPPYLRRRIRGVLPADQIELPISIPVTLQENTAGGPRWLIDPLECNQLLAAGEWESVPPWAEGNVALNVQGRNLGDGDLPVEYELVRGGVDLIRACHAESVVEEVGMLPMLDYPIRRHMVGYAPQSREGQRESVPAYALRSSSLAACTNQEELGGDLVEAPCWRTFGRDRSLAALDWKLVIPLYVDGGAMPSAWLTGEGLDRDKRPVIEDLVLFFRYRARPIREE